jgi:hypothetical protein
VWIAAEQIELEFRERQIGSERGAFESLLVVRVELDRELPDDREVKACGGRKTAVWDEHLGVFISPKVEPAQTKRTTGRLNGRGWNS